MTFSELVDKIKVCFPSFTEWAYRFDVSEYRWIVLAAAITICVVVFIIVFLIKSKHVRLPLLTEVGMFLIAGGMIAVADGLFSYYSDPIAVAMRWFFVCTGFILIVASGAFHYMQLCRRIGKPGQRISDMMPLDIEIRFVPPKGVRPPEDWHG